MNPQTSPGTAAPTLQRTPRLLIISPTKDEAEFLQRTVNTIVAQTVRPALWVIVDDGSEDETGAIADRAAAANDWVRALHRPRGAPRAVGPGVVHAFYAGLETVDLSEYDYVCKLDGDVELPADYFERLLRKFEANPRLGTTSGMDYVVVNGKVEVERTSTQFSRGMTKLYRRECFEAIGGLVREVMWDGIDCHRCRMLGWEAESDPDPALAFRHLRVMGSSHKSLHHGRLRWGRGQHFMGTHPLYMLAITAYRMAERPYVTGGLCILAGYALAACKGQARYGDAEFRRHLHRWQFAELRRVALAPFRKLRNCLAGDGASPVLDRGMGPVPLVGPLPR